MKKFIFTLALILVCSLLLPKSSNAALFVVDSKGNVISEVLGDSTLEVKKVVQNITPTPQIALTNTDGKIELNGVDVSSYKDTLIEVQARANTNEIKIGESNGKFTIQENNVSALTSYPLTIDSQKNELLVTTQTGDRIVNILPFEATQSLIKAKFVDEINNNQVTLQESVDGKLQYQINGTKNINLFNVASIKAPITALVSATTGELLKLNQPPWLKFFGFVFNN